MAFYCNDCESIFYEPEEYQECVGEFWGMPAYESFGCCPCCGSENYEEMLPEEEDE